MSRPMHERAEGCLSDLAIDRLLAGTPRPGAREHVDGCASCRERLEAFGRGRAAFLADESLVGLVPKARPRRWPIVSASVGALALAAAALLFVRTKPIDNDGATTRLKGSPAIGFFVKHGDAVKLGTGGETTRPGDALRFFYTAQEPRWLAVLSLDGARRASVYYPSGVSTAERVEPAVRRPLESSTVLDDTLGTEHLYGVFCAAPIALEPVRASLERDGTLPPLDGCQVDTIDIRKEALTVP